MKQEYVLGIAMNYKKNKILLIRKTKPDWQQGLLNAVGGKIEKNESPMQAMVREFEEETGLKTSNVFWTELGIQENEHFKMYIFYMIDDFIVGAKTTTEEEVSLYDLDLDVLDSCGVDRLGDLVRQVLEK